MSTSAHDQLLSQCLKPDGAAVVRVDALSTEEINHLVTSLAGHNIQTRQIDASRLKSKADVLRELASAFAFPSYFGHNWDALIDCWSDLSWMPPAHGWVCILHGADALRAADEASHDMLLSIAQDVADRWRNHDAKAVFKLLRVAAAASPGR